MIQNYQVVSPSLDGILRHESIVYEGLRRPFEIERIFDRGIKSDIPIVMEPERARAAERYLYDLYGILIKRISQFAIESEPPPDESVKLLAMLQEFVKVKGLLCDNGMNASVGV